LTTVNFCHIPFAIFARPDARNAASRQIQAMLDYARAWRRDRRRVRRRWLAKHPRRPRAWSRGRIWSLAPRSGGDSRWCCPLAPGVWRCFVSNFTAAATTPLGKIA